ncbi:hypothetical protein DDP57_06295 [Helicobacter pylori]|uniref:Uncharacterized protein n=1 Tax=Helicobacter pylori NY40 TaxID=1426844 RepID=A0A060PZB4_HELPX|nr:hypothetical protein [Helicobacter pylori]MBH0294801.1 hypothetical protein [Helicobacter pylori]NHA74560.1 hypothetical protein [Helicobacter pylori]NHB15005.1 hypothetical protein [Helicobacter pylori]NHB32401.1 hypothetical protein [Helicobacter pylori]NHB42830.1 hypothetical protein [Helicobacter pylori]
MPSHKNHYLSLTYFFNELAINKKHESSRRFLQLYLNFKEIPCKNIQAIRDSFDWRLGVLRETD